MPKSRTAADQVRRDRAIVVDRARGLGWSLVAERNGVSERQARRVWANHSDSDRELLEAHPVEALKDALEQLNALTEEAVLLSETTPNDAVRLGAIRTRRVLLADKLELQQACGVLPFFERWGQFFTAGRFVRAAIEVLDRHDIDEKVELDLLGRLEEMSRAERSSA